MEDSTSPSPRKDSDDVLTGTTVKVYRFLVTQQHPVGPRELQKKLKLSSPAVASFHLEKLLRNGLATKNEDGAFSVDRVYLKHYVRLRRRLIPRYFFYALFATFLSLGWLAIGSLGDYNAFSRPSVFSFIYGPAATIILAAIFWYETINVARSEKI